MRLLKSASVLIVFIVLMAALYQLVAGAPKNTAIKKISKSDYLENNFSHKLAPKKPTINAGRTIQSVEPQQITEPQTTDKTDTSQKPVSAVVKIPDILKQTDHLEQGLKEFNQFDSIDWSKAQTLIKDGETHLIVRLAPGVTASKPTKPGHRLQEVIDDINRNIRVERYVGAEADFLSVSAQDGTSYAVAFEYGKPTSLNEQHGEHFYSRSIDGDGNFTTSERYDMPPDDLENLDSWQSQTVPCE